MVKAVSIAVAAIREIIASRIATAANKNWFENLRPVLYGIGMVGVGLVLGHSELESKFLKEADKHIKIHLVPPGQTLCAGRVLCV